jgi:DNA-binding MarR family transcriptional regulator
MTLNGSKRFGVHMDAALKVIKQDLTRRFRSNGIDLTPEQWTLLDELSNRGELTQKELAASTFKDAPTVSRIIDLLVKRDLIDRRQDEFDRRKFIVRLTQAGNELYQKSAPIVLSARKEGWSGLTDEDYDQLKTILDTVVSNIQK